MDPAHRILSRACIAAGALGLVACATATSAPADEGDGDEVDAAPSGGFVDAAVDVSDPVDAADVIVVDAAGDGTITLSQSTSMDVVGSSSVVCAELDILDNPVRTLENSYYRVFDLTASGVTTGLAVTTVTFGVEQAIDAGTATVKLHTLEGSFQLNNLTLLSSVDVTINDVDFPGDGQVGGTLIEAPIASSLVPAGGTLVVEVNAPELGDGEYLFMGSNGAGETGPTYLRGPECNINQPTDVSDITSETPMDWVLAVTGTASP